MALKLKTLRCAACAKIVGFPESVHRDGKVFHRECFRCHSCNKQLNRGEGLRLQASSSTSVAKQSSPESNSFYYCNSCHGKAFGPFGFKAGVQRDRRTVRNVRMKVQPPFAHSFVQPASAVAPQARKISVNEISRQGSKGSVNGSLVPEKEFQVAVFRGETTEELAFYLKEGQLDVSKWEDGMLESLMMEINLKQCELGLDADGNALRIVTIVKIFAVDDEQDAVLVNLVNSAEDPFGQTLPYEQDYSLKKVEFPNAFVLECPFSPFTETPRDAGVRLLNSLSIFPKAVTANIFVKVVPKTTTTHPSGKYPGLNSEFHAHHLLLKESKVEELQENIPLAELSPVKLPQPSASGMNTMWFTWMKKKSNLEETMRSLHDVYTLNEKAKELVGPVNFHDSIAKNMGEILFEELSSLDQWV